MAELPPVQIESLRSVPPWNSTEKTTISASYVSATQSLLASNALADPRGGQFHRVTVEIGNAVGMLPKERQGYGWITSAKDVVLVDGLRYAVKTDLGPASVESILKEKPRDSQIHNLVEEGGIHISGSTIALPALLLLRGETKLAEKCFAQLKDESEDRTMELFTHLYDRHRMAAAEGLMNGKDAEAHNCARLLVAVATSYEKAGFTKGKYAKIFENASAEARQILVDTQRRVEHPKPKIDLVATAKLPPKDRITKLMDALDEISAGQHSQPGDIEWNEDSIVRAIAIEGEAAVPSLLDALEKDDRLTRSVSYGRDFRPDRTIATVKTAAVMCLQNNWPTSKTVEIGDPKVMVGKLRTLWSSSHGLSDAERWLNVLRDDHAGAENWLEAAKGIAERIDQPKNDHGMLVFKPENKALKGESLRAKFGAEISILLAKRANTLMSAQNLGGIEELNNTIFSFGIAHLLACWDGKTALPTLQKGTKILLPKIQSSRGDSVLDDSARPFGWMISDRMKAGDLSAAQDFATAISLHAYVEVKGLRPLWTCPDDAVIQAAGTKLFHRISLDKTVVEDNQIAGSLASLYSCLNSPLLLSPAYRAHLADYLIRTDKLGSAKIMVEGDKKYVDYEFSGGKESNRIWLMRTSDAPNVSSSKVAMTVADFVAQELANTKGAPPYLLTWPADKKAIARKEMVSWLGDQKVDWMAVVKANPFSRFELEQ